MREKVYAKNRSKNFMAAVNCFIVLFGSCVIAGLFIGAGADTRTGAWADMFGPVITGFAGMIVGGLCGFAAFAISIPFLKIINKNPFLYYTFVAVEVIAAGIDMYPIWFL